MYRNRTFCVLRSESQHANDWQGQGEGGSVHPAPLMPWLLKGHTQVKVPMLHLESRAAGPYMSSSHTVLSYSERKVAYKWI